MSERKKGIFDAVNVNEYPALPNLDSGNLPITRFLVQRNGVNPEQRGRSGDFHNVPQNGNTLAPTDQRASLLGRSGKPNLKGVA